VKPPSGQGTILRIVHHHRPAIWFVGVVACVFVGALRLNPIVESSTQRDDSTVDRLERLFRNPPDDSRIMMRWWWFGPAVTNAELEREMRLMKEGGIGGFEVQPVYPVALDQQNLTFLSDNYIDALRFTARTARELGLRFDLTLGSGWPYGGPTVPITEAAGRLRVERINVQSKARVPLPAIGAGEKLLAVFASRTEGKSIVPDTLREITDVRDGVSISESECPVQLQFFIASRTGMQVKRPSVGAEGFVVDHLERASVDNYLKKVGERLMSAFDAGPPQAIFCDSLEVYNSDWTDDFLQEFQKRRGYDLRPQLPALVNDLGAKSLAIRHDWGQTLTELLDERFLQPLRDFAHKNRTQLRIQCYGTPAAALSSNAHADLSEGEGHRWKTLSATRWASSANHLLGRPVTSSETWTWLHSPSFRATPLDVKAEADLHFLQGVNQLIGHGWPYTAPGVEYPGWRFYAAGVFNEKNPWWIVMPDVSRYLQRISFLLRQGEPRNDVAIYLPNDDAWSRFTNGNTSLIDSLKDRIGQRLIPTLLENGYNFDFFDDEFLKKVGRVEDGTLVLGGNKYKIVILPNVEQIPTDTLRNLVEFARTGGHLIATRRAPVLSPGFNAKLSEHQRIAEVSKRLFEAPDAISHLAADEAELRGLLASSIKPDVTFEPMTADIGFIHRSTGDAEVYFLVNTSNIPCKSRAIFRVDGLNPEWWDPMSGNVSPAEVDRKSAEAISVMLELEPYGSRVLVFTRRKLPQTDAKVVEWLAPIDVSAGWRVTFGGTGAAMKFDTLRSWTDDDKTRFFSGQAKYETTFTLPDSYVQKNVRVRLEFGEGEPVSPPAKPPANGMRALLDGPIREAAIVTVNGQRVGAIWCPPYAIDITDSLKRGENKLQIDVANTAINYMAGHALPDYRLLNLRFGERFQPQDMDQVQPIPSGLFGKIRLTARQLGK